MFVRKTAALKDIGRRARGKTPDKRKKKTREKALQVRMARSTPPFALRLKSPSSYEETTRAKEEEDGEEKKKEKKEKRKKKEKSHAMSEPRKKEEGKREKKEKEKKGEVRQELLGTLHTLSRTLGVLR